MSVFLLKLIFAHFLLTNFTSLLIMAGELIMCDNVRFDLAD